MSDESININIQDNLGRALLHSASKYGNNEIIKILFKNNPELELIDKEECTPISLARNKGHIESMKYLEFAIMFVKLGHKQLITKLVAEQKKQKLLIERLKRHLENYEREKKEQLEELKANYE